MTELCPACGGRGYQRNITQHDTEYRTCGTIKCDMCNGTGYIFRAATSRDDDERIIKITASDTTTPNKQVIPLDDGTKILLGENKRED